MDLEAFIARQRGQYIAQFRAFLEREWTSCERGAQEERMRLGGDSPLYRQLYCADFVRKDGEPEIVDLEPTEFLRFEAVTGRFGNASLLIDRLDWDDVKIEHDAHLLGDAAFDGWFTRWFDPEGEFYDSTADMAFCIHSLLVRPGVAALDMGTADAPALLELMQLIDSAGATRIRVTHSRES